MFSFLHLSNIPLCICIISILIQLPFMYPSQGKSELDLTLIPFYERENTSSDTLRKEPQSSKLVNMKAGIWIYALRCCVFGSFHGALKPLVPQPRLWICMVRLIWEATTWAMTEKVWLWAGDFSHCDFLLITKIVSNQVEMVKRGWGSCLSMFEFNKLGLYLKHNFFSKNFKKVI